MTTSDPILASRILPAGIDGYRVPRVFRVEGGLWYLRGNAAPYFSLTYTAHRRGFPNQCYSGGAGHDEITRWFGDRFEDLAALHLSDINGVPMHAEENGWYWLAGALGGAGETYHGGTATPRQYPLDVFARHCRITHAEAEDIRDRVALAAARAGGDWKAGRAHMVEELAAMRPRWKAEADAAIERHHLRVFGDTWPPVDALGRIAAR